MAYPKIARKTSHHYIVIGTDGYRSDNDDETFIRKGDAEAHAKDCDDNEPTCAPHKVVKMVVVTEPVGTDGGAA